MVKMAISTGLRSFHFLILVSCLTLVNANDGRLSSERFEALSVIKPSSDDDVQAKTVQDLIKRTINTHSDDFHVEVKAKLAVQGKDTFTLSTHNGKVTIQASSGVAAATGFYYYIKHYCNCHISWGGSQIALPKNLPVLKKPLTVPLNDRFRYYQNVCTVSYSFAWMNWTQWEKQLDWMAMHAINLPLAFNGQEAIFQRIFLQLGLIESDLDTFFGGPAFLAWSRMGNIQGWGGPLTESWHSQQMALQHQILQRMRNFGMIPVLPAFAGHVPHNFTRIFPSANVTKSAHWGSFNDTYSGVFLLDPFDPLFVTIGAMYIKEYTKEFGTNHIYSADTFNEMPPGSGDPSYLAGAGKAVYRGMADADPDAIWVMQAWLFRDAFWTSNRAKALLTSVPQGRMIVLDLSSDVQPLYGKLQSYFGQPFIWNMLHDFGGTIAMFGAIESINEGPFAGRNFTNSTMIGIGLTPEGINQNDFIYEFMMENAYTTQKRDLDQWSTSYARQRYGKSNSNAESAWRILKNTVYNIRDGSLIHGLGTQIIVQHPILDRGPDIWYDVETFFKAWDSMVNASTDLQSSNLFRYDLVDVTRQAMQIIFAKMYDDVVKAYRAKDALALKNCSSELRSLLGELDLVLSTDTHFLLGHWLEDAKSFGKSDDEKKLLEYNARIQITLWGPDGNVLDYANKQWSGLIDSYYAPRWQLFLDQLEDSLATGNPFNVTQFNEDAFKKVEQPFTFNRNPYPTVPQPDCINIVKRAYDQYRPKTIEFRNSFRNLKALSEEYFSKKKSNFKRYSFDI